MQRLFIGVAVAWCMFVAPAQAAVTPSQRMAQIDQAFQANQQALGQYTWQQQELITVNGAVKKQVLYQVKTVAGGLPQRTLVGRDDSALSPNDAAFAAQVVDLAEGYAEPQPGKLVKLLNQGNVVISPTDSPHVVSVRVQNYLKDGDDCTIVFDNAADQIVSISVASYLTDPLDMVRISAQFALLPGGVNHLAMLRVNGLSNRLVINEQNLNYQKHP